MTLLLGILGIVRSHSVKKLWYLGFFFKLPSFILKVPSKFKIS